MRTFARLVRHLDADHRLAGDRREDAHAERAHRHREVVGERDDAVHLDAGRGLELVGRDDRPRMDLANLAHDLERAELGLEHARARDQRLVIDHGRLRRRIVEVRQIGQAVGALARERHLHLAPAQRASGGRRRRLLHDDRRLRLGLAARRRRHARAAVHAPVRAAVHRRRGRDLDHVVLGQLERAPACDLLAHHLGAALRDRRTAAGAGRAEVAQRLSGRDREQHQEHRQHDHPGAGHAERVGEHGAERSRRAVRRRRAPATSRASGARGSRSRPAHRPRRRGAVARSPASCRGRPARSTTAARAGSHTMPAEDPSEHLGHGRARGTDQALPGLGSVGDDGERDDQPHDREPDRTGFASQGMERLALAGDLLSRHLRTLTSGSTPPRRGAGPPPRHPWWPILIYRPDPTPTRLTSRRCAARSADASRANARSTSSTPCGPRPRPRADPLAIPA